MPQPTHPSPSSRRPARANEREAPPLEAPFQRITRLARRLLGAPIAGLSLADGERHGLKSNIHADPALPGPDACIEAFCDRAGQCDDVFAVADARTDPRFADIAQPDGGGARRIAFFAACPLKNPDGSRIATLCVMDYSPRRLAEHDRQALRDLAALAELELREAFQNAVQEDLVSQIDAERRRVLVDPLTRVWSRAGVIERLSEEYDLAVHEGRPFALGLADLDFFKAINDTRGHSVGDDVLCQASRRMVESIREGDTVGRHGGEEFLLVLGPVASRQEAAGVAERVRRRVGDGPVSTHAGPVPVTISVGVVYVPRAGMIGLEDLIEAADRAMYRAKEAGRDRVEWVEVKAGPAQTPGENADKPQARRAAA